MWSAATSPIWVQSMTTTNTFDVEATVAQIRRLEEAGCEIVRVTVPKKEDVEGVKGLRDQIKIPLIADIHYDYRMALACLEARTPTGRRAVDKIRINPGNIGGEERFKEVVRKAKSVGMPMRIGVNSGSLEKDLIEKYGFPCPEAMVESALRHIETAEAWATATSSSPSKRATCPRPSSATPCLRPRATTRPTSASPRPGSREYGTIKSAAGIGAILLRGIGDTIRVSLLGDPVPEIAAGFDILRACDRRVTQPEVVACPTCGRLDIDLERIVAEVEAKMRPTEPAADQHPRLPGQRLRRGQGGRPGHRGRLGQGDHLQARSPDPPRPRRRDGPGPARGGRAVRSGNQTAGLIYGERETEAAEAGAAYRGLTTERRLCDQPRSTRLRPLCPAHRQFVVDDSTPGF